MEDKPSTSTSNTEIVKKVDSNAHPDKKDTTSKNDKILKNAVPKRKSWLSIFSKKTSSKADDKKLSKMSKSLSTDDTNSVSPSTDHRSMSDSNIVPDDDCVLEPIDFTTQTSKNLDDMTTPIWDDEPLIDNDTFESASGDEGVVVKILDQNPEPSTIKNIESAIKDDIKSTSDGDIESVQLEKGIPNGNESMNENVTIVSPGVISDDITDETNAMNHDSTDFVYACETAAATEGHMDSEDKVNSEENEYAKTMERRLFVLREQVETERANVNDLSLMVNDIIMTLKNTEASGFVVSIPNYLVCTDKEVLIFNNIKSPNKYTSDTDSEQV